MEREETFFSQGTYGCVNFPPIKCKGIKVPKKTISKLGICDFFSKNELFIGKLLKQIENVNKNVKSSKIFVYYNNSCNIKKKKIEPYKDFYDKCNLLHTKKSKKNFTLLYGPYVPHSIQLSKYLNTNFSWNKIFLFYNFALKVCRILKYYKIIHYDIKSSNILVSNHQINEHGIVSNEPSFHLIDFGMSISIDKALLNGSLNLKYLHHFLFFSPSFNYWSIEHHILSYYIDYNMELSLEKLNEIISKLCNNNYVLEEVTNMKEYKIEIFEFYKKKLIQQMSIKERIEELFLSSYETWDMYSMCYLCLSCIYKNKLSQDIQCSSFIDILQKGIHYDYKQRPSISEHIDKFEGFLMTYSSD